MKRTAENDYLNHTESFSVATLIYARLRRVTGRVIDVMYLVQNPEYAKYVIEMAISANDTELQRHAARLYDLIEVKSESKMIQEQPVMIEPEPAYDAEITAEEIYKAQVSHHYIGALR